ncbi:hypothetical protein [Bellilinea sp.]|uniref:hypothetical protein n=1 Tax=Bellilinea sp. TaxID=2838785 RepID=UPI0021DE1A1E|nr:hypothetical protein [Bellilinea sp.]GIV64883.1 MAG: hypothetical protein KatS3mg046_143 [Bellilinea sp.]
MPNNLDKVVAVINIVITEDDIVTALSGRKASRALVKYLADHLASAIDQHVYDEIRYLSDAFEEERRKQRRWWLKALQSQ